MAHNIKRHHFLATQVSGVTTQIHYNDGVLVTETPVGSTSMVEINIRYLGGLRCEATHAPSGNKLITDAPVDNHGKGESFSPTDLVATALGTCMLTVMGIVAERNQIDLSDTTVKVTKEMVATPIRRIGRLTVTIHVPHELSDDSKKKLEHAAHTCPVHKSLLPDVETVVAFRFGA
jgi:putative redox protein